MKQKKDSKSKQQQQALALATNLAEPRCALKDLSRLATVPGSRESDLPRLTN